ncbi:hypothetical protein ABW20_dc0107755 [Dactylellina cionopaga]|nr:hypothetical protein ABW20_dc0107755 [Dactylellina cionopaga]
MPELNPEDYTIVWIAPLEIEARAALLMLDNVHDGNFALDSRCDYVFQAGDVFGHNVVIASLIGQEYGTVSAATLASQKDGNFIDPGQGNDRLYEIGDDETPHLVERKPRLSSERTRVWYGPMGSGDTLMKNAQKRNELRDRHRIIGLEMEAAGVVNCIPVGVIRGVCDYGDENKNKEWQPYAAAMAAAYAKAILNRKSLHRKVAAADEEKYRIPVDLPDPRNHNFKGREDVFRKIRGIFCPSDSLSDLPARHSTICPRGRVTLCGLGGSGKSAVALEYAYKNANEYSAIFWVNGAKASELITSTRRVVESIANNYTEVPSIEAYKHVAHSFGLDKLKISSKEDLMSAVDKQSPVGCLRNWLCQKSNDKWLLIIDNYDDPNACDLDALLPTQEVGHIIITSRNPKVHRVSQRIEVPSGIEEKEAVSLLSKIMERKFSSSGTPC